MMNVQTVRTQQYCLKWNNHNKNVSGVFDRLRISEQFVDVTLSSADQKTIKCHRLLLSAGSGYLEEILAQNPSDHPTIVLSQIAFEELKLLVDFMYAGEVSVEQDRLARLLEAAKILKIKGLYETPSFDDDKMDKPASPTNLSNHSPNRSQPTKNLTGSQKRKRKNPSVDSADSTSKSPTHCVPMYGVSNAYYFATPDPHKDVKPPLPSSELVPNLLSRSPVPLSALNNENQPPPESSASLSPSKSAKSGIPSQDIINSKLLTASQLLSAAPVRRYKQYTEDSLQQALKEIMEGQSINRSSMKFNIPARTLRDWMKRLNIKSVFTHNNPNNSKDALGEHRQIEENSEEVPSSLPDMISLIQSEVKKTKISEMPMSITPKEEDDDMEDEEEEEEIDDDEEETLKIDEGQ